MSGSVIFTLATSRGGYFWGGAGYIAGEDPGLVTVAGSPAAREVEVRERRTRRVVATTRSASDGTYRIDGLNPDIEFDLIARDDNEVYNDVIRARVKPIAYA